MITQLFQHIDFIAAVYDSYKQPRNELNSLEQVVFTTGPFAALESHIVKTIELTLATYTAMVSSIRISIFKKHASFSAGLMSRLVS